MTSQDYLKKGESFLGMDQAGRPDEGNTVIVDAPDANIQREYSVPETFDFENNQVRVVYKDGQPWFVAKDVCDILEIGNNRQALTNLDPDEKGVTLNDTPGGRQQMNVVNESGLYSLIMQSRKPNARQFRKWVTGVVLPSIRKSGSYSVSQGIQIPRNMEEALECALKIEKERQRLEGEVTKLKPHADYAKKLEDSSSLSTTSVLAKQLGVSAIKLNEFLHKERVLFKQGEVWLPYAKYQDQGLGKIIVASIIRDDEEVVTYNHWKWTETGRRFVLELWGKRHNLLPIALAF